MKNTIHSCDDDRLQMLLDSDEQNSELGDIVQHVETCQACQARLTELAADQEEWAAARQSFVMNETEQQVEQERLERSWCVGSQSRAPKTWTDAMTRQLLSEPSHPEMLGRLGRYEIERLIGSGGMGIVFKGFDSELNRPVAIKVLAPHLAGSSAARKRFAREARAAAAVVHEHVVAIHNVDPSAEPPFLVMHFVAGESLQNRLDRQGALSVCEILRIAHQTAAGLSAAHKQGLVHRDVKPSNIMLEQGVERALLTDFGLARASDDASLTHSGHVPGTPHYMSPEQARGDNIDHRSDLFSLGSVMYAMCTGRLPFRAETSYGVLRRITDDEPTSIREVNPEIPDWLSAFVERLMQKTTDQRFESADEIATLLEQCLAHVQQPNSVPLPESCRIQPPPSLARRALKWLSTKTGVALLSSLLLLLTAWQVTKPPDISGKWTGDEWGQVRLTMTEPGHYVGTYTDTFKKQLGKIDVKWSRVERRFKGTWQEGSSRFGDLAIRLIDGEMRGAWNTSPKSEIEPGVPEISDLLWKRGSLKTTTAAKTTSNDTIAETSSTEPDLSWDSFHNRIQQLNDQTDDVLSRINQSWSGEVSSIPKE